MPDTGQLLLVHLGNGRGKKTDTPARRSPFTRFLVQNLRRGGKLLTQDREALLDVL